MAGKLDLSQVKEISKSIGWSTLKTYIENKQGACETNLLKKKYTSASEIEVDRKSIKIYKQIIKMVEKGTDK